jgi:hypothetical protein
MPSSLEEKDISHGGGAGNRVYSPTAASLKTMRRLVSSIHFILNPPRSFSYSAKAAWISRVLSSGGNPCSDKIRVTQADKDIMSVE